MGRMLPDHDGSTPIAAFLEAGVMRPRPPVLTDAGHGSLRVCRSAGSDRGYKIHELGRQLVLPPVAEAVTAL